MVEYAKLSQKQFINNEITFIINGQQVKEDEELTNYLLEGKNTFSVSYKSEGEGVTYNLEVVYQTFTPTTAAKASLSITISLNVSTATTGETVRMSFYLPSSQGLTVNLSQKTIL